MQTSGQRISYGATRRRGVKQLGFEVCALPKFCECLSHVHVRSCPHQPAGPLAPCSQKLPKCLGSGELYGDIEEAVGRCVNTNDEPFPLVHAAYLSHAAVNAIVLSFVRTDEGNTGMWRGLQLKSPVASQPSACNPFPPSANAPQSLTTHPTHSHPSRRFPAATMQPAALQCDRHEN